MLAILFYLQSRFVTAIFSTFELFDTSYLIGSLRGYSSHLCGRFRMLAGYGSIVELLDNVSLQRYRPAHMSSGVVYPSD